MDSNPIEKINNIAEIYRKKIELREKIKYNLKYKNCYFGKKKAACVIAALKNRQHTGKTRKAGCSQERRRLMAKYRCMVCGFIYDEEKEGIPFKELKECPVCHQPTGKFALYEEGEKRETVSVPEKLTLDYQKELVREDESCRYMKEIHQMAVSGQSVYAAMGTRLPMPGWDDILILGAQLDPMPLEEHAPVNTTTVIGKHAKKPMILENPVYISHMSFGALSKEAKVSLARGSAMAKSAMCSGEGGILPEEQAAADKYIFEYVGNLYSVTPENLRNADAIEIKIGQGTKPGMGGHLPAEKVTREISAIRGKPMGQDVIAPSRFPGIETKEDLKDLISQLRYASEGRPIGVKIAAGHIEKDLAFCVYAEPDFITIDGRGGATGSSPLLVRDATSLPTIYALSRARKYLDSIGSDIDLIITGGLRVSSDFAKALAMGASAVAIASAALMALGCQQYRICGSGLCPMGIATQKAELRERLHEDAAALRVANFLNVSLEELKTFARITGHENLHDLSLDDLCTISREISEFTDIRHA